MILVLLTVKEVELVRLLVEQVELVGLVRFSVKKFDWLKKIA